MKRITVLLCGVLFLGLCATVAPAQTVKSCSPAKPCTIQWSPNTEADMKEYRVLLSKTAGQYDVTKPAAVIAHPVASGDTTKLGTLTDGPYYLVVVAVDTAGQVSPYSNEVTFRFDGPPGAPVIELIAVTIP